MANLIGEAFQKYVNDQIRVRQNTHGKKNRTTKELQYLNTRNAWVKMASAVHITQDRLDLLDNYSEIQNGKIVTKGRNNQLLRGIYPGKNLALKNVLFGGLTSFGSILKNRETNDNEEEHFGKKFRSGINGGSYRRAYGVGGTDQFGYSPMPGIIDMEMKCLNRGSIKKIQLNIKCHNRSQFDVIDVLYLRLGYSVFIEWGYDKYLNNGGDLVNMGSTLIDKEFWLDKYDKSDYTQWIPMIEKNRNKHSGNYDGIFGTVSNFSWTFENDGTYNIKVDVISLGDIIESLKVNLPSVYLSQGNSFYGKKFAELLENTSGGTEAQNEFYSKLYPGLDQAIEGWYDRCKIGWSGMTSPPLQNLKYASQDDFGCVNPGLNYALSPDDNFGEWFKKIKGSLGEDHEFYEVTSSALYTNEEMAKTFEAGTSGAAGSGDIYRVTQEQIRNAIEYAITAYYFHDWDVGVIGSTKAYRDQNKSVTAGDRLDHRWQCNTEEGRCFNTWFNLGVKHSFEELMGNTEYYDKNGKSVENSTVRTTWYPLLYYRDDGEQVMAYSFTKYYQPKEGSDATWYDLRTTRVAGNIADMKKYNIWKKRAFGNGFNTLDESKSYEGVQGSRGIFNWYYEKMNSNNRWKTILESTVEKQAFQRGQQYKPAGYQGDFRHLGEIFSNMDRVQGVNVGISKEWILEYVYHYFTNGVGNITKSYQTLDYYRREYVGGEIGLYYYAPTFLVAASKGNMNLQGQGPGDGGLAICLGKGTAIPPSEEGLELAKKKEELANLTNIDPSADPPDEDEQKANEVKQKQLEEDIARLQAVRDQQISDFKNQNKNRIYRHFYNIREILKKGSNRLTEGGSYETSNSSNTAVIRDVGDIYFPNLPKSIYIGDVVGYQDGDNVVINTVELYSSLANKAIGYSKDAGNAIYKWFTGSDEDYFENTIDQEKETQDIKDVIKTAQTDIKTEMNAKNILFLKKLSDPDQQCYMRLGCFLNWLQSDVIPKIQRTKKEQGVPMIRIDTNINQNICYVIDNVVSLDIRKIIVSNSLFINGLTDTNDANSGNSLPLFPNASQFVATTEDKDLKYGQIMNIYFSFDRLQEIFDTTTSKSDVFLFGALKDICNDINDCLGNITNIEPVVDDDNIIHFVDQTTIPGLEKIANSIGLVDFTPKYNPEDLLIYGYQPRDGRTPSKSNFVRNIGLTTEISKEYATMITIGATSNGSIPGVEATAFSRWNTGIKDRFKNHITDATENTVFEPLKTNAGKEVQSNYATLLHQTVGGKKGFGLFGLTKDKSGYFTISEDDIEFNRGIIEDFYKLMQAQNSYKDETDKQGNTIESSVGFLPFNLKITLDGISGIKIYNKLTIQQSFLPSNYPESLDFVVTQVNHKLSNNDWVTELETIATSKSLLTNKKKKTTKK